MTLRQICTRNGQSTISSPEPEDQRRGGQHEGSRPRQNIAGSLDSRAKAPSSIGFCSRLDGVPLVVSSPMCAHRCQLSSHLFALSLVLGCQTSPVPAGSTNAGASGGVGLAPPQTGGGGSDAAGGAGGGPQSGGGQAGGGPLTSPPTNLDAGFGPDAAGEPPPVEFGCASHPNAYFCDEFESGINSSYKVTEKLGGTVQVDTTRPHSGASSLHATSQSAAYSDIWLTLAAPIFPVTGSTLYVRAFIYYAPPGHADNVYLFRVAGNLPNNLGSSFAKVGAEGNPYKKPDAPDFRKLATAIYHSSIKSADHHAVRIRESPDMIYGKWACWEFLVDRDNHEWRVWIDGIQHIELKWSGDNGAPWQVPEISEFRIGIEHPHPEPAPFEVWFDDLVIGPERVGCGTPP